MRRSHIELFRLAGIAIRLHVSWFAIAILVVWTLATSAFPAESPGLSAPAYWLMGVVGALGLFTSIVIHESCHALVARRDGIPMSGITLFVFGGVAEMEREPATPGAELRMAAAGPAASVVLALLGFGAVALLGGTAAGPAVVVVRYVALFNAVLAAFNLVPAFPLDGGRMLRAALWQRSGDLQRATRVASRFGNGFGIALMLTGVVALAGGLFVSGVWWILIGLFVRTAARESYVQVVVRASLAGRSVRDFMTSAPALLSAFVEPAAPEIAIAPDADALQALTAMARAGRSRLLVVEDGRPVGVLSRRDLLDYSAAAMEPDGRAGATSARNTSP